MASGTGRALRDYHERTKHSLASVRAGAHHLDWDNQPLPFKVYPELPSLPLPDELPGSQRPAFASLSGAASPPGRALDPTLLAHLLYFSAGVLRQRRYAGGEIFYRAAACTGALYHVDAYVACSALSGLDAGLYHFGPHDFALRRLRAGDQRAHLVQATGAEPAVAGAPVLVVLASTFWRNAWKYRTRTYRHCFWDAGTLVANLLAATAALGVPARIVTGFVDDAVTALVGLDPMREAPLAIIALGTDATPAPTAPAPATLALATLPLSREEIDYPLIREAHVASSLPAPDDVARWRAAPGPTSFPAVGDVIPLAPLPESSVAEPIEAVILRRGSTRRFPRAPIALDALATILTAASAPVALDVEAPSDCYLIANAVDGLPAGAYAVAPDGRGLTTLRTGDFRREAGFLGLGQELPADAAACLYWLVDLEPVFARLGDRGYRVAQLEAAIAGGRTYLAAYALGLGATGLTFFDDDVTAFFSPHAAGKSVMFHVAVGRRPTSAIGRRTTS
jgi:SagB-type dehydrogenase family enzyme